MSEHIIILEILIIITKIRNQKPDLFDAVGQLAAVPNGICLYCAANIVVEWSTITAGGTGSWCSVTQFCQNPTTGLTMR